MLLVMPLHVTIVFLFILPFKLHDSSHRLISLSQGSALLKCSIFFSKRIKIQVDADIPAAARTPRHSQMIPERNHEKLSVKLHTMPLRFFFSGRKHALWLRGKKKTISHKLAYD